MPFTPTFYDPLHNAVLAIPVNANTVDGNVFVADRRYRVVAISEVHSTAGSDGSAVTLAVRKCAGTTAPASGTAVHSGTVNLKGTANTTQSLTIDAAAADLDAGDRLALDVTGTLTALAGGVVTIVLRPI